MAAAREEEDEHELRHDRGADHDRRPALPPARRGETEEDDAEEDERDRARRECQDDAEREEPPPPRLQRPEREQRKRDAERERERAREDEGGPEERKRPARPARRGSPLRAQEIGERERRDRRGERREQSDPEHRRERVVDEAVADEAVPAGVPVVVPEDEAVAKEERALVRVCGEVGAWWPEPGEQRRDGAGGRRGDERLTMARQHGCKRTLVA